jgi:hypothetical protein
VTVVIVVTMIFAPAFKNNHWIYRLVGKQQKSHAVRCVAGTTVKACPARKRIVRHVYRPLPKNALARCKGHRPCLPRKAAVRTATKAPPRRTVKKRAAIPVKTALPKRIVKKTRK